MQSRVRLGVVAASLAVVLGTAGCHVSTSNKDGKNNVSIETPLGGLNVKTDPSRVLSKVGMPQYPGSWPLKNDEHDPNGKGNKDSADVDMSFGNFHLRVLAASFETADAPGKVEAYYRGPLARFSDVIACRNQQPIGQPAKTGLGLTCSDDTHHFSANKKHVNVDTGSDHRNELELKAGSPSRQHIVSIEPRGAGTRIALISLELPHDSD